MNLDFASGSMDISLLEQKNALRSTMRRHLAALSPEERLERSVRIGRRIAELPSWRAASQVLLFAPLGVEPDLDLLWTDGGLTDKRCAYPRMEGATMRLYYVDRLEELEPTRWGLREPPPRAAREAALGDLALVLVPGLAFDAAGGRLGRGGGFYDRLLAGRDPAKTRLVGVSFSIQRTAVPLPLASHDVKMDDLITG